MNFAVEPYADVAREIVALGKDHWNAIGLIKDIPFDPWLEIYEAGNRNGNYIFYTVRRNGVLVGYAVFCVIARHFDYNIPWAQGTGMWIRPEDRRFLLGDRLLAFIENDLKNRGIMIMQTDTREGAPALGRLLAHRGHKPTSRTYTKDLRNA